MPNPQPDYSPEEQEMFAALGRPATQCPPVDVLQAIGQEVLPQHVETAAAAHLAACPLCQMLMSDRNEVEDAPLSDTERQRIASTLPLMHRTSRRASWAFAIAAALLFALGLTLWKLHPGRNTPEVATTPPPAPTVTAQLAIPPIPVAPLSPPSGTTLTTRGAISTEPPTELLLPPFRLYNQHEYRGAEEGFRKIQPLFPKSALIPLYMGVSQLMQDKNEEARQTLSSIDPHSRAHDDAAWYLAVAASRQHAPDARTLLTAICQSKASNYSGQACAVLGNPHRDGVASHL